MKQQEEPADSEGYYVMDDTPIDNSLLAYSRAKSKATQVY